MTRRTSLKLGTAWGASLALHVLVGGVLAVLAVRAALEPARVPERHIDFDEVGAAPLIEDTPRGDGAVVSTSPTPDPAPLAPYRVAAPLPLAETIVATSDVAGALPAAASDAWLAPAPIPATAPAPTGAGALLPPPLSHAGSGEVTFAGLGSSNARSVVYVVDVSGPMVSSLREVVGELERSVSRLGATQRFGVVAFRRIEGKPEAESFMPVLVRATPKAKQELHAWLVSLAPAGRSNPLAGLRMGLEMRADAVFLLSRGIERSGGGLWELSQDATMAELDRLNPVDPASGRRGVIIKTIQFIDEDPTGTMQQIGRLHGQTVSGAGRVQPGYRVIRSGADLQTDAPLEELR